MKFKIVFAATVAAAGLGAAVSALPGLETLNWSESDIRAAVQEATRYDGSWGPMSKLLNYNNRRAVKALDAGARTQLVTTGAPIVKALIMSPAFMQAHEAWIATQFDAVNHSIKVAGAQGNTKDPMAQMQDVQRQLGAQMYETYRNFPVNMIKDSLAQEMPAWQESLKDASAEDRARYQKLIAKAKQIQPLAATDPAAYQKGYGILKSIESGGPDNEAELTSMGGQSKKQQQQRNYDRYNLRAVLKKRLNEFVRVAGSVDYAAATAAVGNRERFTDAKYEKASSEWKLLYRFGKAPSQAAAAFAQQWAREL